MRYAVVFTIYGVALLLGAVSTGWPVGVLVAWPAASCLLIAGAYGLDRPGLLGKRPDGTVAAPATIALAPYLVLQHVVWFLAHRVARRQPMQEVAPGLWLGQRPREADPPQDVRAVIDLTAEFHESAAVRAGREYVCLPTLDATAPPDDALARLVDGVVTLRTPVLVHCASGHGRSALVAACVLCARGDVASPEEAVARIVAARRGARLNRAQTDALHRFSARRATSVSGAAKGTPP